MDIRDEIITGSFSIGSDGRKEPIDWKDYALKLEAKIISRTTKDWDYIEDNISDIMINDGPDGHSDGSGIIADFVVALLNGTEDEWIEEYEKRCIARKIAYQERRRINR